MKYWKVVLLGMLGLCACGVTPSKVVAPPAAPALRQAAAPIWSIAQFDAGRIAGEWRQAAGYGAGACEGGVLRITGKSGQMAAQGQLCQNGHPQQLAGPVLVTGPGRLNVAGQDWWVIWVDADYRTLAIASPHGAFGYVLNRGGALPADRMKAAAEIFDFNGYSRSDLVRY